MRRFSRALALAWAALAVVPPALGQSGDPLRDPATLRVREGFTVDGIALFDPHADHAARMGVCAPSIFAGLKWCVSGNAEETRGAVAYTKTTGYNTDGQGRIVYVVSTRRGYPLKRDEFEAVIQGISERFGAGAALYALRKAGEDGAGVDSLIAVWGGIRLVHLSEAEYAVVEAGNSLRRGHLVDHRFNLVASAKQREPVYKIEGDAGYVLHLAVTGPERADVIARVVYQPAFATAPARPGAGPAHPLVADAVRRPTVATETPSVTEDRDRRADAERALASERLLREEAERKAAEEQAARAELEEKLAVERRAAADLRRQLEEARRSAEESARRSENERKALDEQRARAEAERKASEDRWRRERDEAERRAAEKAAAEEAARRAEAERRRAEDERRAAEERYAREALARKAREREEAEHRARAEAERQAAEEARRTEAERRRAEEARRAAEEADARASERAAQRKAEAEGQARERAARPAEWYRLAGDAAQRAGAVWTYDETQDRVADERALRAQTVFGGAGRVAVEVAFECMLGRERRLRATARGYDRRSGAAVAFRTEGEGAFGVRTRIRIDDQPPQDGLMFRERQDDVVSIVEVPVAPADLERKTPRAGVWLRHYAVSVEFGFAGGGTVIAAITPYAPNLRRVLEACAE